MSYTYRHLYLNINIRLISCNAIDAVFLDSGLNLLLDFDEYYEFIIIALGHQNLKYPWKFTRSITWNENIN